MSPDAQTELPTNAAALRERALELYREKQALEGTLADLRAEKAALESDNQALLRRIGELTRKLATAEGRDQQLALALELKVLKQRLGALNQEVYGTHSERRPSKTPEAAEEKKAKKRGHGPKAQTALPLREEPHVLDEADQTCPECGGGLDPWVDQFECSEEVTVIERRYELVRHKRQKYRCQCCRHIDVAAAPPRLVPGGRYSLDFAVAVAVDKYDAHLPLSRQVQRMQRAGLAIASQTLWDQIEALALLLMPVYKSLHTQILAEELVHVDETTWRLMEKGGTKKWWVWAVCTTAAICYVLLPSRSADAARLVLQSFAGIVMADGYAAYETLAGERSRVGGVQLRLAPEGELHEVPTPDYALVLCWMHARRPFFKAEKVGSREAGEALELIGELYAIEARAREEAGGDPGALLELRKPLRDTESRALIDQLDTWRKAQTRVLPQSHLGKGLGFLENHWKGLTAFLDDPRIPLDNGEVERGMRGPVLGRKNHYGSRSEQGTLIAAIFYSLIETCKRLGVDPGAYLKAAALHALDSPGAVLLPSEFAARQKAAAAASATEAAASP